MRRLQVFDTTLRDGEQSLGITLNIGEKIRIAKQLTKLGVDVIEAGFPASSPGDFEAVQAIAKEAKGVVICGLTRAIRSDIERCAQALSPAEHPRIHTGIATSALHMKHKLRKTPEQVLEMAIDAVSYARRFVDDVQFYAEDAFRSDREYLKQVFTEVIKAGATVINIPDTVGYATPWEFTELIQWLYGNVSDMDKVTVSIHCHNDLGMATANSLAGIKAGATQVEGTINGIGERAGNAALEEILMAIYSQKSQYGVEYNIKTSEIARTSQLVSVLMGVPVYPYKAIVGSNAYSHASGIHQDGVLKERATYEIINPEIVGFSESKIVLTGRSGRHALKARLEELGYSIDTKNLDSLYARFLEIADAKGSVTDEDLNAICGDMSRTAEEACVKLISMVVTSGHGSMASAVAKLEIDGEVREDAATGTGPVDAVFRAIDRLIDSDVELKDYSLKAVTSGRDAIGEVLVKVGTRSGVDVVGRGVDTDILKASAIAYTDALNKLKTMGYLEKVEGKTVVNE